MFHIRHLHTPHLTLHDTTTTPHHCYYPHILILGGRCGRETTTTKGTNNPCGCELVRSNPSFSRIGSLTYKSRQTL